MPRDAGIPNKNKSFLMKRLQDMYGDDFHPIIKIASNCVELQKEVDTAVESKDKEAIVTSIKNANNEWARIAEYTEPKLKAVDVSVSGPDGGAIQQKWTVEVKEVK